MAFFIGAINCNLIPLFDYFILSRTDSEKSANWLDALLTLDKNISMDQSDWLNIGWKESIILRIERWSSSLRAIFDVDNRLLLKLWNYLSDIRLKRGQTLLQRGKVVISDRLHVHILSILLNKPHVVIDNKYRKLGNLHDAWTFPYRGVRFVTNLEDALNAANELKAEL
jgi:pyruvyl transferase EpsO